MQLRVLPIGLRTIISNHLLCLSEPYECLTSLWQLSWNLVHFTRELHAAYPPGDRLPCIVTSWALCLDCGDIYAPSEGHMCYTLGRGSSCAVAIYPITSDVCAFLWLHTTFYFFDIAIYLMLHSPNIYLAFRYCNLFRYSFHFRYNACHCISFNIILIS